MQQQNEAKTALLYDMLDNSKLFLGTAHAPDRSLTNVPFTTGSKELDEKFITQAEKNGLKNIRGHVLAGGMRASMYNIVPWQGRFGGRVKGLVSRICVALFLLVC